MGDQRRLHLDTALCESWPAGHVSEPGKAHCICQLSVLNLGTVGISVNDEPSPDSGEKSLCPCRKSIRSLLECVGRV